MCVGVREGHESSKVSCKNRGPSKAFSRRDVGYVHRERELRSDHDVDIT